MSALLAINFKEKTGHILYDRWLGKTRKQRRWVPDSARRWSAVLNGLGIAAMFWVIFRPQPYHYLMWTLILLPLITLAVVYCFDGAITFEDNKKQAALPSVLPALMMPCLGLSLLTSTGADHILNWDKFWFPFAASFLLLFFLVLLCAKEARCKLSTISMLVIFCPLYGSSTVILLNSTLDISAPFVYHTRVLNKRESRFKGGTSHYLMLSPWGSLRRQAEELDVSALVYNRYEIGSHAEVVVRQGKLAIPWFYVQ